MNWRDLIGSCFGTTDLVFAGHALDEQRARKMLFTAISACAKWEDIEQEMRSFLMSKNSSEAHIENQIRKAKDITNYLSWYDTESGKPFD